MKRILLGGFLILVISSRGLAQQPVPYRVEGGPVTGVPPATAVRPTGDPACCGPTTCGVCSKTVCMPEVVTKETVKPRYSCVSEPLCFPKWSLGSLWHHGCEGSCPNCEHPRTKYYLVVRPCVEERPGVVCKPVLVETCEKAR